MRIGNHDWPHKAGAHEQDNDVCGPVAGFLDAAGAGQEFNLLSARLYLQQVGNRLFEQTIIGA